jgi:hypothetical protein
LALTLRSFRTGSGRYGFGHAPAEITNAYICWALTETGESAAALLKELDKIIAIGEQASKSKDPYYLRYSMKYFSYSLLSAWWHVLSLTANEPRMVSA